MQKVSLNSHNSTVHSVTCKAMAGKVSELTVEADLQPLGFAGEHISHRFNRPVKTASLKVLTRHPLPAKQRGQRNKPAPFSRSALLPSRVGKVSPNSCKSVRGC
jgi:hypothetical protein